MIRIMITGGPGAMPCRPGAPRSRVATGQAIADQIDQERVVQELVHGLE